MAVMAAESTTKRTTIEDIMLLVLGLVLVGRMVETVPRLIEEHFGLSFSGARPAIASALLDEHVALGTEVVPLHAATYHSDPGAVDSRGTFEPGTLLRVVEGPVRTDGELWWRVEDTLGAERGWVPGSALVVAGAGGIGARTDIGTQVQSLVRVDLWHAPGGTVRVGTMQKGEQGTLADGPRTARGGRWWFVDRSDTDADGWVPEGGLMRVGTEQWLARQAVRAVHTTDLFARPGGGATLGVLTEGDRATILTGPEFSGETAWWLVEPDAEGDPGWVAENSLQEGGPRGWAYGTVGVLLMVGTLLTIVLLGGLVYATIRTNQIRAREAQRIRSAIPATVRPHHSERWEKVLSHISTDNPNDWRLAIIEADVMLDELVTKLGYPGLTLGERLKQAPRGDFKTLDAAWEAHKVRNQIAHAGSDYVLTQRDAKRVIDLYGAVFGEFHYHA